MSNNPPFIAILEEVNPPFIKEVGSNYNIFSKLMWKVKNKLIIAKLNINSVPGKFEQLKHIIQNKVDIIVLADVNRS